jgi:prepilin-type N-terminal cleavage/methylation domain-containing protein
MNTTQKRDGFTLIELLVVIAIIGVLSSIVIGTLSKARLKAESSRSIAEIKNLEKDIFQFVIDTGVAPGHCSYACVASNDPLLNQLGVAGWKGPYNGGLWKRKHGWGGQMGILNGTGSGVTALAGYNFISLDDDAPGTSSSDNSGRIPEEGLLQIDKAIDDGNLSTGRFTGGGYTWTYKGIVVGVVGVVGEGSYLLDI